MVAFEGDAKASKTRSAMKWWSKCISMAIAKTASRNVAFKVAKMREAIMKDQDEFLMPDSGQTEVGLETNNAALCKIQTCILPMKTSVCKFRRIRYTFHSDVYSLKR